MKIGKVLKLVLPLAILVAIMGTNNGGGCSEEKALQAIDQNNPFAWIRYLLGGETPGGTSS